MRFGTWWTSCLPELRERLNGGQHLIDGDKDLAKTKACSHEIACSTRPNSGWPQPVTISSCSTIPSKPGTTWANRRSIHGHSDGLFETLCAAIRSRVGV